MLNRFKNKFRDKKGNALASFLLAIFAVFLVTSSFIYKMDNRMYFKCMSNIKGGLSAGSKAASLAFDTKTRKGKESLATGWLYEKEFNHYIYLELDKAIDHYLSVLLFNTQGHYTLKEIKDSSKIVFIQPERKTGGLKYELTIVSFDSEGDKRIDYTRELDSMNQVSDKIQEHLDSIVLTLDSPLINNLSDRVYVLGIVEKLPSKSLLPYRSINAYHFEAVNVRRDLNMRGE